MDEWRRWLDAEMNKQRKLYLCQGNCKFIVADEI